jgi:uncharacterized protein (DUF433 family)
LQPHSTGTIPVWLLELERHHGRSEIQSIQRHPSLSLEMLRAAFDYAASNQAEIERQIASNEG